ncbi:MAG: Eco57I restriction-modification methylase domain-containing protein [Bacteroidota bacterium]
MILTDINKKLEQLKGNPSRENIFDLSFTLLQWMNVTPNAGSKPQLVTPQTQKLKEYLFPAPQTVQPQLYRLTADNQNIRVRFAVLKKLKQEYISQLVDNDPGLSSYQSIVKGLTKTTTGAAFIPTQPYFIHFVTTPDYDKLVLIFNQGDQKRILSFRNRLTHTQYDKIIPQWTGIATKSKPEIADLLWKSLDIKEVNKEFYRQIKERFDALLGIVKIQHASTSLSTGVTATDNQVKQFTVRLIGRYIFCWFLKEKGIIPDELISSRTIKTTGNYYQSTLLKLFFDTLNTRIQDRVPLARSILFEKIPYLNGGLFDESEEDRLFRTLQLDDWLIPFVEVLENYDFTVDESSSTYQQVAVDPEMLGRIFENLLASQNPETEKAANNERKAFGAFYTPRDIVDYMVNESLKTYLATKLNVSPDELSPAFLPNPVWPEKLNKRKHEADIALQQVKILDPACGSGAFPMGVLHRLVSLRELLGLQPNTYQLKKDILSDNIYGIDIMPMAVEIARLRAWLSLIVEEDYKSEKSGSNFGIDALPNLDFKFMQGNSLLETYEGVKLFDDRLLETKAMNTRNENIERVKGKRKEIEQKIVNLNNKGKLKGTERAILEKELKDYNEMFSRILKVEEPTVGYGLFNNNETVVNLSEKLHKIHTEFFATSDKEQKKKLKEEIESLEWNLIAASLQESGKTEKLKDLENLRRQNIKPYFLYKLNFPEVFTEGRNGFDIIIGNPPYVRQEAIDPYYKPLYIQHHPEVGSGTADLYVYFFDSALAAANTSGVIIFITLNKYLKTKYGEGLRNKLKEKNVDFIIDFFELPVFEASTDTAITKIINAPDTDSTKYFPVKTLDNLDLNVLTKTEPLKVIKDGTEWKFVERAANSIIEKIYANTISLQEFTGDKIYYGIKTGDNKIFIIDEKTKTDIVNADKNSLTHVGKYITATEISKWFINYENEWLITTFPSKKLNIDNFSGLKNYLTKFKKKLNPKPKNHSGEWIGRKAGSYKWFETQDNVAYYEKFEKPKIIYIHTAKKHEFYLDCDGIYINNSCYMIASDNKFLFFFLNSILFDWFKRIKFVAYGDADEAGRVKLDYNKMITVPIKQINEKQLQWFEKKYDAIKKSLSNTSKVKELENEVETTLFKLYNLTYKEVKIMCPEFWLSVEEYEKRNIELN